MACSIATIQSDACANGFYAAAQNEHQYRVLVLQILCNGITPSDLLPILDNQSDDVLDNEGNQIFFH